jgi:YVTN family beta-propeller protein
MLGLARTAHNRYNNRFCLKSFELNPSNQNFFFGVPMSFRRVGWVAAIALATLLEISCGQVYRPVVIPTSTTPPNPANFHAVFGISANVPLNPGAALQIDVSGDTDIGQASMGVNPTHATILPNNARVFVANAGASLCAGGTDSVTAFFPAGDSATTTGLGTTTTFTVPNIGTSQASSITAISEAPSPSNLVTVSLSAPISTAIVGAQIVISGVSILGANPGAYDGCFPIVSVSGTTIQYVNPSYLGLPAVTGGVATVPTFCPYLPDFVATTQNTGAYVANFGAEGDPNCDRASTDSVMALNSSTNTITNLAYLPAAAHPVAMVETPSGSDVYVLNQGNNTVSDLSAFDLSTVATIPVASSPVWAVARPDGQRVYVVTQGDASLSVPSQLYTINTATNAVIPQSPQSVGAAGANFVLYDKSRNRLYVTNPNAGAVYVFDATTDPPAPVGSPTGIGIPLPSKCSSTTCSGAMPVSVAALPDGSRLYVASYATPPCLQLSPTGQCLVPGPCPDGVTAAGCVIPQVTVFDAASLTVKTTIFPLLPPVTTSTGTVAPYALAPVPFCAPLTNYSPAVARFRMSAVAAADGSRVYASLCDGGSVAIVNTTTSSIATGGTNTPDTLVTDLPAPFSAAPAQSGQEPPPQNPVFLLIGQ